MSSSSFSAPSKGLLNKRPSFRSLLLPLTLTASLLGGVMGSTLAHAVVHERAIMNSQEVLNSMHNVPEEIYEQAIKLFENGTAPRIAPELPIWIAEIKTGTILYYEGNPELKGAMASVLVDHTGFNFGERTLRFGNNSRSGWMTVTFNDVPSRTYCDPQYPYVACTLIPGE